MKRPRMMNPILLVALMSLSVAAAAPGRESLTKWHPLWTRQAKAGLVALDADQHPPNVPGPSIRVDHRGQNDWSLTARDRVKVGAGDVLELAAWLKVSGRGEGQISVVTYDAAGKVVQWLYALRSARWISSETHRARTVPHYGSGPPAAIAHSCAKPSASRLAPPTSAPSTSGCATISPTLLGFTEPP